MSSQSARRYFVHAKMASTPPLFEATAMSASSFPTKDTLATEFSDMKRNARGMK